MAYLRPIVMVYQEYASTSTSTQTTTLYPCIVGPCYQIVDAVDDEALAYLGAYTATGITATAFPSIKAGAELDAAAVAVRFKSPVVNIGTAVTAAGTSVNVVTFTQATYPTTIALGDTATVLKSGTAICTGTVIAKDDTAYTVSLSRTMSTETTGLTVQFQRAVPEFTLTPASSGFTASVTVNAANPAGATIAIQNVTVQVGGVSQALAAASVYVGYRALRTDLAQLDSVGSETAAKAALGKLVPDNPLGMAMLVCLANTTVPVRFFGVATDDLAGYTDALDQLANADDVYALVPLTQDHDIINAFNLHSQSLSVPEKGLWRSVIAGTALPTTKTLASGKGATATSGSNLCSLKDPAGHFLSGGAMPGDTLSLTAGTTTKTYTVSQVTADDLIVITGTFDATDFPAPTAGTYPYAYTVTRPLTKDGQAQAIAATATSFGYRRFVHVWPDRCSVDSGKKDASGNTVYVDAPSYYLASAVAGMTGGLKPHQGFTRISIAGVNGISHSNDYFSQAQLDTIAGGGNFIFMQASATAAPYVRHQLTTDMSAIEFQEFSFVKNFDYVSIICKDTLDRFIGRYNITAALLGDIHTAITAVLESLKLSSYPKIGSPVLDYKVVSVAQLASSRDRVEAYANVWLPYAMNYLGLHLVSQ